MEKRTKAAAESGVLLLVIAGILIAANVLSTLGAHKRFDATKSEKYTLSKGSGNLLRSMKQNLQIDAYVTRGLPKLDAFVRDLRDLLQEYKEASGGKLEYTIIEAKDEETKKTAKDSGLVEQPFGEASDTEEKAAVTQGFMGMVFKYGAEKDGIKHKIGVLTGHDEIKLTETNLVPANMGKPSMQQIVTQNFPFYTFQDVDLKNGDGEVDDALDGLIITQPGKDLSEKELRRIDQFVMKGKSLAIFASAVNVKNGDASMNATLGAHGLEKLTDGYGIGMNKDAVLDFGRSFRVSVMTQGGVASARFPDMIDVQDDTRFTGDEQLLDTSFAGFFRIPELVFPFASSLTIHSDKQPEAKVKVVARTTPRSMLDKSDTVDLKPFKKWLLKGESAQYAIAAQAEGTLKSAFVGGDKQGVDVPEKSAKSARVFVVSSSQFLANPFARAGNGQDMQQFGMMQPMGGDEQLLQLAGPYAQQALTGTILAFKNTLDWLSGDTDLLAVSAKILQEPGLVYGDVSKPKFDADESEDQLKKRDDEMKQARKGTQNTVAGVLILGVPLLFALYGVLRWRLRQNARANVSLA
jgi:ABC-type uncharacterized transport system involved in gliding motility auxiliary subunit